jgi:hypothetical protein
MLRVRGASGARDVRSPRGPYICFSVLSDSAHGNTYGEYSMQEREMMNDSLLTCYDVGYRGRNT